MSWKDRLRHPVAYLLSLLGHWEWEHAFKTCPTGDRHCQHLHWRWGLLKERKR